MVFVCNCHRIYADSWSVRHHDTKSLRTRSPGIIIGVNASAASLLGSFCVAFDVTLVGWALVMVMCCRTSERVNISDSISYAHEFMRRRLTYVLVSTRR